MTGRGWRYRGQHRTGALSVAVIVRSVAVTAEDTRRAHLRSLRRPFNPGPVFIGTRETKIRLYGALPNGPDDPVGTLVIVPPDDVVSAPPLIVDADDAPTAPIPVPSIGMECDWPPPYDGPAVTMHRWLPGED